jgi:hypothetical protein
VRKVLISVLGPFAIVATAAIGYHWWDKGAPPGFRPTYHPVTVQEIDFENRGVRIQGTAHYEVRLWQTMGDGARFFVFPLMAPGDTTGREVQVLVRTARPPDDLATYEDVLIDGLARPPGDRVGHTIWQALRNHGYDFADEVVLVESHEIRTP